MPDAADFAALFTSLKAITDLAKFFIDAHDAGAVREKAIDSGSTEPPHFLCPDCFEERRRSILQEERRTSGGLDVMFCHRCGLEISRTGIRYPEKSTKPSRHR